MELVRQLALAGWKVEICQSGPVELGSENSERYPTIPPDYATFLSSVRRCVNPAETAWFLCEPDYNGTSGSAFRWNEFEGNSLLAAERDPQWQAEIRLFWDLHLPILTSIKEGYAYLAISFSGGKPAGVVYGREPEFEHTFAICDSFTSLLQLISDPSAVQRHALLRSCI